MFGYSYGGAVRGEFCKIDVRCLAGVNLDGDQFGLHWADPLQAPFLAIYHQGQGGGNDFAYEHTKNDFYEAVVEGTEHADFSDIAYVLPALEYLGELGNSDKTKVLGIVNGIHLDFFDHYLKGAPLAKDFVKEHMQVLR